MGQDIYVYKASPKGERRILPAKFLKEYLDKFPGDYPTFVYGFAPEDLDAVCDAPAPEGYKCIGVEDGSVYYWETELADAHLEAFNSYSKATEESDLDAIHARCLELGTAAEETEIKLDDHPLRIIVAFRTSISFEVEGYDRGGLGGGWVDSLSQARKPAPGGANVVLFEREVAMFLLPYATHPEHWPILCSLLDGNSFMQIDW